MDAGRAVEWFLARHAPVWFRLWPGRLAAIAAGRAVRRIRRLALKAQADARLREQSGVVLQSMLARAAVGSAANGSARPWSRRELVARSGLSWGTFHRALSGGLDLKLWVPRLRAAADRLTESTLNPQPSPAA